MISEKEVICYKGLFIRHIVSDTGLELVFAHTEDTGEKVVTKPIRPAIGGCRHDKHMPLMEACEEVFGLATGMDAKNKRAGINGAGAKTVVMSEGKHVEELGEFVEYLHSIGIPYIISVDGGYRPEDMTIVAQTTQWVSHCNPSPDTARGVAAAIEAYADMMHTDPTKLLVFVRGLGEVGAALALNLSQLGYPVIGCDKYLRPGTEKILREAGVQIIPAADDFFPKAHIYAPCTLGGEISEATIPLIAQAGIRAIIGSSNHQLKEGDRNAVELHRRGILWAVAHVVNRCGLLRVAVEFPELFRISMAAFERAVAGTGTIVREMFEMSLRDNIDMIEVERRYFGTVPLAA